MKVKVGELTGQALDWAVAKCEGVVPSDAFASYSTWRAPKFSTDWSQGGPIIEREGVNTVFCSGDLGEPRSYWVATNEMQCWQRGYGPYHEQDDEDSLQVYRKEVHVGPTPLIAAMRCYVASKLGDEVDVPKEIQ